MALTLGLVGGRPQVQLDGVTPQDGEARLVVKQGEAELVVVEGHAPLQVARRQGRYGVQHPQAPRLPREPVEIAILPGPRAGPMGRASQAQQESLVTSWVPLLIGLVGVALWLRGRLFPPSTPAPDGVLAVAEEACAPTAAVAERLEGATR